MPFWDTNSFLASYEIPLILWDLKPRVFVCVY
jgi:hypothetical protein